MTRLISCFSILALALLPFACGGTGDPDPGPGTELRSDKQRVMAPDVPGADVDDLVAGHSAFALDFYHALAAGDAGNLFFSPYSISVALGMTWGGARNDTEAEMASAMHFSLPQDSFHPAVNYVDLELASRGEGAQGADEEPFRLNVVNSIWGQEGYGFLDGFLDLLALNYGAGLRLMDFVSDPDGCAEVINDWVEEQTEDRIQDLIPPGTLDALTRLVLVNAIYFNAAWDVPFEEEATYDAPFHTASGAVQVPFMHQTELLPYAAGDGYQVVELPYDGEELSMVILLPEAGRFDEIEAGLDVAMIGGMLGALDMYSVELSLPRWTFRTPSMKLKRILSGLGMPDAFEPGADFSGMDGKIFLYIGDVIHKAFIAVNEAGTEAAAATAVIMEGYGVPDTATFDASRPFIYFIRDIPTGSILFMGRVSDPS
ncbi:MAG: serpin family protein [Deltaproteobacteria bacterium]|nr:serpin family protein [Deltaproteobacteria bacterium]